MQSDSAPQAYQPSGKTEQINGNNNAILFSPLRLVLYLALVVFIIEVAVNWLLTVPFSPSLHLLIPLDSFLLTLILVPFLFRFLYRPLLQLIADYRSHESQLRTYQEQLEEKVLHRTIELDEAVRLLEEENAERRRTESILQESEERFHQIFDQSEDAIVLVSPADNAILDANPTAERLFNKNRDSLISGSFTDLCRTTGSNQLGSAIADIITDHRQGSLERFECRINDDEKRTLSFRGKMIKLQDKKVVFTSFRDITPRILLEQEALKVQARLIHTNRMTSLGMLVSSVAHEINNPNNYILINAGLIKQAWANLEPLLEERFQREGDFRVGQIGWCDARQFLSEAFAGIQDGARRIGEIVENLREYGRDDRSGHASHVNVNDVVRLSASILNHHISRLTDNFKLDMADNLPLVKGSPHQLEQVVINLIQNSLQSLTDQKCGVYVSTGFDDETNEVLIHVTDEGKGIPKELTTKIMEPFFTTRLENGGTGLGLSICSAIIKDHGGKLEFCSENGCGATFSVRLPAAQARQSRQSVNTTREANDDNN